MSILNFFNDDLRRERLVIEARRWLGTRFVSNAAVIKGGVDCVRLCAEIYKACGALEVFDPPKYSIKGGHHYTRSIVLDWLNGSSRFRQVAGIHGSGINIKFMSTAGFQIGDLFCLENGKLPHHVGIKITDHTFIQADCRYGVIESECDDPAYLEQLRAIYRVLPL